MSEHMFGYGPEVTPRGKELQALKRVAAAHGLDVIIYPAQAGQWVRWGFHGPNASDWRDVEDAVQADLDADADFRAWCSRHGFLRRDEQYSAAEREIAENKRIFTALADLPGATLTQLSDALDMNKTELRPILDRLTAYQRIRATGDYLHLQYWLQG